MNALLTHSSGAARERIASPWPPDWDDSRIHVSCLRLPAVETDTAHSRWLLNTATWRLSACSSMREKTQIETTLRGTAWRGEDAYAPVRRAAMSFIMSGGSGASKAMRRPSTGCTKLSRRACRAWRENSIGRSSSGPYV